MTWSSIAAAADQWRARRRALVGEDGARVGLLLTDPLETAVAVLGAFGARITIAPLDPNAPVAELVRMVRSLGLVAVVTDGDGPAVGALAAEGVDVWVVAGSCLRHGWVARRPAVAPPCSDAALVMTSSGTTGVPKIVPLAERQLLHAAGAIAAHHRLGPDDRGYCPLPMFHINALVVGVLSTLVSGGSLVLDRRFSRRSFWSIAQRYDVTWVNLVPAIIAILAESSPPPADVARRIRFARSASAPLAAATMERFEGRCGIPVLETYGMTEAASQIAANPLEPERHRPGSVGMPVGVELRIVDDTGAVLPAGAVGMVQIRGDSVISSYWTPVDADGAPRTIPATDRGGWLPTGDLGRLDEDGYLYLAGRDDDVINRGGEKIYPREIEEVLLADERVRAAVVVGRPHPVVGEEPVAFVIAAPESTDPDGRLVEELSARCQAGLSAFKRPTEITVAETLPSGPTGKVRRGELRRLIAESGVAS